MELVFNPADVTIGDLEDFEEITGHTWSAVFNGKPDNPLFGEAKVQLAIVFITARHDNPEFTLEEARNVRMGDLEISTPEEDPADPTELGEPTSGAPSA